jgi:hypothetical protein
MNTPMQQLRNARAASSELAPGIIPRIEAINKPRRFYTIFHIIFYYLLITTSFGAFIAAREKTLSDFLARDIWIIAVLLAYGCWPIIVWMQTALVKWQLPDAYFFNRFSKKRNGLCIALVALGLVYGFYQSYPYLISLRQSFSDLSPLMTIENTHHSAVKRKHHQSHRVSSNATNTDLLLKNDWWPFGLTWLLTAGLIYGGISRLQYLRRNPSVKTTTINSITKEALATLPFSLWLGRSTGNLANLSHGASIAPHQEVSLTLEDAAQNMLVLGGIGSGKTTRAMHPFLIQLLDQNCGGLIFDIKGDFQQAVLSFADQTKHPVTIIGPNYNHINLLHGLTPEIAASFLKSIFLLSGKQHSDAFWVDTATELCRNTLGILSFLPQHYSLGSLYHYLFDTENRLIIDEAVNEILFDLDEKSRRLLNSYWQYQERIFDKFDEKIKAGVNATIAQVLAPFNHPDLIDAFCTESQNNVRMEDVLNGAVYLVSLPLSVWGLGGKVVYTFIKLRFYNVMQQRSAHQEWNQTLPVFFMCDEFQEIVSANKDGLSDLNFWDKSRSSKTIGIISAQAISSFYAAIGNHDITHALLQNFRQKICFRIEDAATLHYFNHLTDKVEVIRNTYGHTRGSQSSDKFFNSQSVSNTENTTIVDKPVLDAQLFRKLQPNQAVALLSINGHSMDDIIGMLPVYVESPIIAIETKKLS